MADFEKTIKLLETAMNYNSVGLGRIVVHHDTLSDALELLKSQPQIVRCKDCRFAHLTYDGMCKQCEKATDDEDNMLTLYLPGDFFCGYGEPKEGNKE